MSARRTMWAIVRRDLRALVANKTTTIPMVVLPVVFFAALPLLIGAAPGMLNLPADQVEVLVGTLPSTVAAELPTDPGLRIAMLSLVYLMAPMFLLVPLMLAIVAAAGAIAGERERGTLEILLLSPVTDRQLFVAKTVGAWLPAVTITLAGAVVYQAMATWMLADTGLRPFPNLLWTLLIVWVSPAVAAAALGAVVAISARMRTFQDALQASGLLVLPLLAVVVAQAAGLLVLGPLLVVVAGAALWALAGLLLPIGARAMQRDRLQPRGEPVGGAARGL